MINGFCDFRGANEGEISDYYRSKNISQLTIEEMAFIHLDLLLGCQVLAGGVRLSSCLYDLFHSVITSFNNVRTKQYVPLMGCFAMLDQIGGIYGIQKNPGGGRENNIKRALRLFSNFKETKDLDALVTLRHGIFHDGSLVYSNQNKNVHVFFRMKTNSGQLLTQPSKVWDGVYRDDMSDFLTYIDLRELQSLTRQVIERCRELLLNKELQIKTPDPRSFFYKYLFSRVPGI